MRNFCIISLAIAIAGCATVPRYDYQSTSAEDSVITFGEKYGGDAVLSPARWFNIRTSQSDTLDCAVPRHGVGVASNHWMLNKKTIDIKVPKDTTVAITGARAISYAIVTVTCLPQNALVFKPLPGKRYSVDIVDNNSVCPFELKEKAGDHYLPVDQVVTTLRNCEAQ